MATKSFDELIAGANTIKDNQLPESNTSSLVGDQLVQMSMKLKEENASRMLMTNEYNVSVLRPTGGVKADGTAGGPYYTLETATAILPEIIAQVGGPKIQEGSKISFYDLSDGKNKTYEYHGTSWILIGANRIEDLEKKISIIDYNNKWEDNALWTYINNSGSLTLKKYTGSTTAWNEFKAIIPIKVNAGEFFHIKCVKPEGSNNAVIFAEGIDDGANVINVIKFTENNFNKIIETPEGSNYIFINKYKDNESYVARVDSFFKEHIDDLDSNVNSITKKLYHNISDENLSKSVLARLNNKEISDIAITKGMWFGNANPIIKTDGNFGKLVACQYKYNWTDTINKAIIIDFNEISDDKVYVVSAMFISDDGTIGATYFQNKSVNGNQFIIDFCDMIDYNINNVVFSVGLMDSEKTTFYDLQIENVTAVIKEMPTTLVVAKDGSGDYSSIQQAVSNAHDNKNRHVTILIKNGVYEEHINVVYKQPNGNRRYISFIGENRNKCIIWSKEGIYTRPPLWIDGDFNIENLTFKMTSENVPDGWSPTAGIQDLTEQDMLHQQPGYAIHIDTGETPSTNMVGSIRNCYFYSECNAAIGMGLHGNQTIIIENSTIEWRNCAYKDSTLKCAYLVHNATSGSEDNQCLILKNVEAIADDGKSIIMSWKHGTSPNKVSYKVINSTFWCEENNKSNVEIDTIEGKEAKLHPASHGNNAIEFNAFLN